MTHIPAISVIIPAYDAARTVGVAVDSVLAQTFEDFELIVVDDGSRDATADVVRAREDPRLRCVTTPNGGVAQARNHGLALTSGALVAFLDADDAWHPTKLARQDETMTERPSVGLCYAAAELVDDRMAKIGEDPAPPRAEYCEALLTIGNIVSGGGSSAMVKRSLLTALGGFDPRLSQTADWDMWLRLSLETDFAAIAAPLVRYRKAPDTMSSDPALLERDTFAMFDKFFANPAALHYRPVRRRAYGRQWMVCAGTYLHAGRIGDSLRCLLRGLAEDPRSIRLPLLLPARSAARLAATVRAGRAR
jgi:glycosyltransferase involved in cell wall biosynthesis